jgi:hypothetical protein
VKNPHDFENSLVVKAGPVAIELLEHPYKMDQRGFAFGHQVKDTITKWQIG